MADEGWVQLREVLSHTSPGSQIPTYDLPCVHLMKDEGEYWQS